MKLIRTKISKAKHNLLIPIALAKDNKDYYTRWYTDKLIEFYYEAK